MSFDGPFGAIEYDGNLLISLTGNDQQKDFPFARRQSSGLTAMRLYIVAWWAIARSMTESSS